MLISCNLLSLGDSTTSNETLSESQFVSGIKEALILGSKTAAFTLSDTSGKKNGLNEVTGYLANELIRIALPAEVENAFTMMNKLSSTAAGRTLLAVSNIDFSGYREAMIHGLNRGAENAAGLSVDVFKTAITEMNFSSAKQIVLGADSIGATNYLDTTTRPILESGFRPVIDNSFGAVKVSLFGMPYSVKNIWSEFSVNYNKVAGGYQLLKNSAAQGGVGGLAANASLLLLTNAGVGTVDSLNTDIVDYATVKALNGLFYMVGVQETKIRKDPVAALASVADFVTSTVADLIEKIFKSKG